MVVPCDWAGHTDCSSHQSEGRSLGWRRGGLWMAAAGAGWAERRAGTGRPLQGETRGGGAGRRGRGYEADG